MKHEVFGWAPWTKQDIKVGDTEGGGIIAGHVEMPSNGLEITRGEPYFVGVRYAATIDAPQFERKRFHDRTEAAGWVVEEWVKRLTTPARCQKMCPVHPPYYGFLIAVQCRGEDDHEGPHTFQETFAWDVAE